MSRRAGGAGPSPSPGAPLQADERINEGVIVIALSPAPQRAIHAMQDALRELFRIAEVTVKARARRRVRQDRAIGVTIAGLRAGDTPRSG